MGSDCQVLRPSLPQFVPYRSFGVLHLRDQTEECNLPEFAELLGHIGFDGYPRDNLDLLYPLRSGLIGKSEEKRGFVHNGCSVS